MSTMNQVPLVWSSTSTKNGHLYGNVDTTLQRHLPQPINPAPTNKQAWRCVQASPPLFAPGLSSSSFSPTSHPSILVFYAMFDGEGSTKKTAGCHQKSLF